VVPLARPVDGSVPGELGIDVGVADGAPVRAGGVLGGTDASVPGPTVRGRVDGDGDGGSDGEGVADREGLAGGVRDSDGVGDAVWPLAGGGASGTAGGAGALGAARVNGSAMRAATTQDRPAPAAARSSLRRAAARRIAS
jgi:hypothetical protein